MDLGQKYSNYLGEKFDTKVFESDKAFIVYKLMSKDTVMIDVLHVEKEYRRSGEGTSIWEGFKKTLPQEISMCVAEIDVYSNSPEVPLVAFIKRGFKLLKLEGSQIVIYNKFREGKEND